MNPFELIRQVQFFGGQLTLEDEGRRLHVKAPAPLPNDLRLALREHKTFIMVALGAPLDAAVASALSEIRPHLPYGLRKLPDDRLLALVNWSIMVAWAKAIASLR